ncbi:uncharacterized protein LOC123723223 [Papilio machaon]|uniref:uncharacterized protein LOC123723223 n=1 Tax=Papilio machaon TaxID=76193 RepID=UPI001E664B94|nr:uncharacterized protein LOC123723223 [Papilio machaon]
MFSRFVLFIHTIFSVFAEYSRLIIAVRRSQVHTYLSRWNTLAGRGSCTGRERIVERAQPASLSGKYHQNEERHFLIGRPLTAPPSQHLGDSKESTLQRYERLEKMQQHFWQRWQREYLSEMQQRTKWKSSTSKLDIGDMVLLADDNAPPLSWKLGRVLRLITGSDGTARVADITTNKGCVRRSLVRLCKLPTAEELQG